MDIGVRARRHRLTSGRASPGLAPTAWPGDGAAGDFRSRAPSQHETDGAASVAPPPGRTPRSAGPFGEGEPHGGVLVRAPRRPTSGPLQRTALGAPAGTAAGRAVERRVGWRA